MPVDARKTYEVVHSYYRARYYDSSLGRFINEDPLEFAGGIDFYRYVGNSPTEATDPGGECPKTCGLKSFPGYDKGGQVLRPNVEFSWSTTFLDDKDHDPTCCQVRQYVRWNREPSLYLKTPSKAFKAPENKPGHWYEDRDSLDYRYGRRSGPHADPHPDPAVEIFTKDSDTAYDQPKGWYAIGFEEEFQLRVYDVCQKPEKRIATSDKTIRVRW